MFQKGDRVRMHDGRVAVVRKTGAVPRRRQQTEAVGIRGFIRGALIDPDGTVHLGDWHENVITEEGHKNVVRCFAGLANSSQANWWAIGSHSTTGSQVVSMQSEFGTDSGAGANTGNRAAITANGGSQVLSSNWTLSQTHSWPATHISHSVTLNAIGQALNSSVATGSLLSIATFASSTKGTNQTLSITYNWLFST